MSLIHTLKKISDPQNNLFSLLIRHSARYPIKDAKTVFDAQLTPEGMAAAEELGSQLASFGHLMTFYSPVDRCEDTAKCLVKGARAAGGTGTVGVAKQALLGPYLKDWKNISLLNEEMGLEKFLRYWFDGKVSKSLIDPIKEGALSQRDAFVDLLTAPCLSTAEASSNQIKKVYVCVTHDWNVMLVREYYLKIRHEEAGWLDFLDGIVSYREQERVVMCYGESRVVF